MLFLLLSKYWRPMSKEEFHMIEQKEVYQAIGFIPKDLQKSIYKTPSIPGRVFE
jgi:hypothetical protein